MADLKPRIPSPIPLPNSGSFLGPNTSRAIPKITSRCIGWNNPSSITPPPIGHALDTDKKQRGQKIRRRDQQVRFSHGARPATQANSDSPSTIAPSLIRILGQIAQKLEELRRLADEKPVVGKSFH